MANLDFDIRRVPQVNSPLMNFHLFMAIEAYLQFGERMAEQMPDLARDFGKGGVHNTTLRRHLLALQRERQAQQHSNIRR